MWQLKCIGLKSSGTRRCVVSQHLIPALLRSQQVKPTRT